MYFLISIPISVRKTRLFKNNGIFKLNYGAVVFLLRKNVLTVKNVNGLYKPYAYNYN